ncbi:MAG: right-handed parallel beta-helix repeat-containing protein, partial [Calditrichaeota bacterium]
MKRSLICLLILLFAGVEAQSQSLSGAISGKLTREQGPYVVSGDLTINPGDSLVIQSGVEVQFQPSTSLIVNGTLIIMGTEGDSVRFRSASAQPAAGDWNGIFLQGESLGVIEYLVVEHAGTGVTFSGNGSVIRYSFFRQNNNGADFTNGAVDTLQFNRIEHNRNAGIRAINAAPVIRSNAIIANGPFGFESAIV